MNVVFFPDEVYSKSRTGDKCKLMYATMHTCIHTPADCKQKTHFPFIKIQGCHCHMRSSAIAEEAKCLRGTGTLPFKNKV